MPVSAMPQTHICTTGNQRGQVCGVVSRTGATAKEHDRVVENGAVEIAVLLQPFQKSRKLLAQKQIILCKFKLSVAVPGMGQVI